MLNQLSNGCSIRCDRHCEISLSNPFVFGGFLLLLAVIASAQARPPATSVKASITGIKAAQSERDVRPLEPGKPIERDIAGGQVHSYRVDLTSGTFLHLVADQRGVDVVVRVFGPDGKQITKVDGPNGTNGPELVSVVAEATGTVVIEIGTLDPTAAPGKYEIRLEEIREATARDRAQLSVQRLFAEAEELQSGTTKAKRESIEKYTAAIELYRNVGDHKGEGQAINNIGVVYWLLGEMPDALRFYGEALKVRQTAGDQAGEAETLNNMGMVHFSRGEMEEALQFFERSRPLRRTQGGEATTLNNIGLVYDSLGERRKALESYYRSLDLRRAAGLRAVQANTFNNIGMIHFYLGESQNALDTLNQALAITKMFNNRRWEADTLQNIGTVYRSLGDNETALARYTEALPLREAAGDPRGEGAVLNNIGSTYAALGENQKSLEFHTRSLALARRVEDRNLEAAVLQNIGSVHRTLGEFQKALDYYHQALVICRGTGSLAGVAGALYSLGTAYQALGDLAKALECFNEALSLARAISSREQEANVLSAIARLEKERGNLSEARLAIEASIGIVESLRGDVGSQTLRSSYFGRVHRYYETCIDVLMQMHQREASAGLDRIAFEMSERGRARSLLEMLVEARADIRQGADASLLERERSLKERLNAKSSRQMRLLSGKHTLEQEQTAAREIGNIITDLQQVQAQIRVQGPRYAALTQPAPLSLNEIQQQLDADTLLLEYSLGSDRSFLWAVTQTSMQSFELPRRAEIEASARRVYELLTARNRGLENETDQERVSRLAQAEVAYPDAASALSRTLLLPVASQLGRRRLLIVSEGMLQYVPFAALPLPHSGDVGLISGTSGRRAALVDHKPLVLEHEIVSLPSSSMLAVLRRETAGRKPAERAVVVLADPVFDKDDDRFDTVARASAPEAKLSSNGGDLARAVRDVGLAGVGGRITRLPFSGREANAIESFVAPGEATIALGFDASRTTATSAKLAQYRFVHFATHGFLNSEHPELSGLVFSLVDRRGAPQDGFLRLHDIYNLNLPAELVVLSACQSGLGKDIKGEGMVGLTRGFMYAGAARVAASLWKVDDAATAELMMRFYRGILRERQRPAVALQTAQIEMWKQKRWQSPYYWAAFVLQGEWKQESSR